MNISSNQKRLLKRLRVEWIPGDTLTAEDQRDLNYLKEHGLVEYGIISDSTSGARITPEGRALVEESRRGLLRDLLMAVLGAVVALAADHAGDIWRLILRLAKPGG